MPISQYPPPPSPQFWALEGIGENMSPPSTEPGIFCGPFWPSGAGNDIGAYFHQAWIRPSPNATGHFIVDTAGGAHTSETGTEAAAIGNRLQHISYNGSTSVIYNSDVTDFISDNEWVHVAWGLSDTGQQNIWIDGIISSITTGQTRITAAACEGLWIFGFNHQAWAGRMAYLQMWDANCNAFGADNAVTGLRPAFYPQVQRRNQANAVVYPDLSLNFNVPGIIPDFATNQMPKLAGLNGRFLSLHPGQLFNEADGEWSRPSNLHPFWVIDNVCPAFKGNPHPVQTASYLKPASPPPTDKTYLLWTDFSNWRSTKSEADLPTLPDISVGALAPKVWQYVTPTTSAQYQYGVRNGYAINMGFTDLKLGAAVVDFGTRLHAVQSTATISVIGDTQNDSPGVIFRRVANNSDNQWLCYANKATGRIYLKFWVAGAATDLIDFAYAAGRNAIRVECSSANVITVYTGINNPTTHVTAWDASVGNVTNAANSTGTWGGIGGCSPALRRNDFGMYATT